MHAYSVESNARARVFQVLAIVAAAIPGLVGFVSGAVHGVLAAVPALSWPLGIGATFGLLYLLVDRVAWRLPGAVLLHGVPNLNGRWKGAGLSSYQLNDDGTPRAPFATEVVIRQTFTRIEVFTETDSSTSRSTMASISPEHAVPSIRYAFENTPKSKANPELQRHPGLIELRMVDSDTMRGDYFSGKHRLRFGELTLTRKKDS